MAELTVAKTELALVKPNGPSARLGRREALAEQCRAAFLAAVSVHGLSLAELARRAGLPNANALYNFRSGRSAGLSAETYRRIIPHLPNSDLESLIGVPSASTKGVGHNGGSVQSVEDSING